MFYVYLACRCLASFVCFFQVTKARPNDKDARMKYDECNKICKRLAFEKAIASDDGKCVADSIDINSLGESY